MPRTRIVTVISLAAALVLLAAGVVVAQDEEEPLGTPPPVKVPDLVMTIVRNELSDRSLNEIVADGGDGRVRRDPRERRQEEPS